MVNEFRRDDDNHQHIHHPLSSFSAFIDANRRSYSHNLLRDPTTLSIRKMAIKRQGRDVTTDDEIRRLACIFTYLFAIDAEITGNQFLQPTGKTPSHAPNQWWLYFFLHKLSWNSSHLLLRNSIAIWFLWTAAFRYYYVQSMKMLRWTALISCSGVIYDHHNSISHNSIRRKKGQFLIKVIKNFNSNSDIAMQKNTNRAIKIYGISIGDKD